MGAYFLFSNDMRAKVKADNPDMKITEIAKTIGEMWKNASEKEKEKCVWQKTSLQVLSLYTKNHQHDLPLHRSYVNVLRTTLAQQERPGSLHGHESLRESPLEGVSKFKWLLPHALECSMLKLPCDPTGTTRKLMRLRSSTRKRWRR